MYQYFSIIEKARKSKPIAQLSEKVDNQQFSCAENQSTRKPTTLRNPSLCTLVTETVQIWLFGAHKLQDVSAER